MKNFEVNKKIADKTGLKQYEVKNVIRELSKLVKTNLLNGEPTYINNLGKFFTSEYKPRAVILPNGTNLDIEAHTIPKFNFSKIIKKELKEY